MFDPDDRDTRSFDRQDQRNQVVAFGIGQAPGDFVEQQQLRCRRDRPRQLQPFAIQQTKL